MNTFVASTTYCWVGKYWALLDILCVTKRRLW